MSLREAISEIGLDKTDAEIVAALNADVSLPHDHTLWSYSGVALQFGPTAAEGIAAFMTQAGLTTAVVVYAARGMDLSLDLTRAQLDAIAENVPDLAAVCAALKAIGRPTAKRYAEFGLSELPSEAEITAAKARVAFAAFAETAIQTLRAAINGEQTDIAAMKTQIAGL